MKYKDNGWEKHLKALYQLSSLKVQLGAVGEHDPEPGQTKTISNAAILRLAETGAPSINLPARMPIRKGMYENIEYIQRLTQGLIKENFSNNGIDVQKIGDGLGLAMKTIVQASIMSRLTPGLSENYLRRKTAAGFSDLPYYKSGQVKNSIDYAVVT